MPRRRCSLVRHRVLRRHHRGRLLHICSPSRARHQPGSFEPARGLRGPDAFSPTSARTGELQCGRLPQRPVVSRSRLVEGCHPLAPRPCRASNPLQLLRDDTARMVEHPIGSITSVHAHPSLRGVVHPHADRSPAWNVTRRWRKDRRSTAPIPSPGGSSATSPTCPPCGWQVGLPPQHTPVLPPVRATDPRQRAVDRVSQVGCGTRVGHLQSLRRMPQPEGRGRGRGLFARLVLPGPDDVVVGLAWVGHRHKACLRRWSRRQRARPRGAGR